MMSRWCDQSIHDAGHSDRPNGLLFGRYVVWNPCRGDHLGQRSRASAPEGRTYGRKRSDQSTAKPPCEEGAVHIWVYVRDDRPFGGSTPPAAMFYYSRDRGGEHPQAHLTGYTGIFQADAYAGYNKLYEAQPQAEPAGRSGVLGACPPSVLYHGRCRRRRSAQGRGQDHQQRSRHWHWRRFTALMPCLTSSAQSMARAPRSAGRFGRS